MSKAVVVVSDPRFPAGSTLKLHERQPGGNFSPNLGHVKTAKATPEGATFKDLEEGATFFVSGEDHDGVRRAVTATAKLPERPKTRASAATTRDQLAQTRPLVDNRTRVAGARGTRSTGRRGEPFVHPAVGQPTPKDAQTIEPHPAPRQEDASGPQRSDTITGAAAPTTKGEPQPALRQDQVPAGTPQRSATPLGEATIIAGAENVKQQDAPAGLVQRSATPHGEIAPLPTQPKQAAKTRRTNRTSTQQRGARKRTQSSHPKRKTSGKTKRA